MNKQKPQPKDFGYQEGNGFDTESGWMYEGGEEAYFEALKKWEEQQVKHTPGPWFQRMETQRTGLLWVTISERKGSAVGFANVYASYVGNEQAIANARLIAAAPEMLAMLEACYEILRSTNRPTVEEVAKVISKAKGE